MSVFGSNMRGMNRIRVIALAVVSLLLIGVVTVALRVSLTGPGSVGEVSPGWEIVEECTPLTPGDSRGSFGTASLAAWANDDSRFVQDSEAVLEHEAGSFRGRVADVAIDSEARLTVAGPHQFLNVDRAMPPIWWPDQPNVSFARYGSGTGEVGTTFGSAVDPVDGGVWVTSSGTVNGVDRIKVIKYTAAGVYVTELGASGSADGQFFGSTTVAVSPVDQSLYVGDWGNSRIQKFTTADGGLTYTYAAKVGSNGSGNGQFGAGIAWPVAVDDAGNVYAGDPGNARIQKFTSDLVYSAKVAVSPTPLNMSLAWRGSTLWALVDSSLDQGRSVDVLTYNSSLSLQSTLTVRAPGYAASYGAGSIAADSRGGFWLHWRASTFVVRYDATGAEANRWVTRYPVQVDVTNAMSLAMSPTGAVWVLKRQSGGAGLATATDPYGGALVSSFRYEPAPLSLAIETYLKACDPTLNGYTFDYQASEDPDVVFPGWKGNVWANLKELLAFHGVELVRNDTAKVFIIRDIGSTPFALRNNSPVTTVPGNLTGGRVVDFIYLNPRAGGGTVWDSAVEGERLQVNAGQIKTQVFATDNHPAELAQPVPTDTLPIQPGQYYVVDSTGLPVPAATWAAARAGVSVAIGDSPGTVSVTLTGPVSNPTGFTGPYYLATGTGPTDTPTFAIVGNGTFTNPQTFVRSESQGNPYTSPFIDTYDRLLQRGHYPSIQDPNVVVTFSMPVADLPAMGESAGATFDYEQSKYRLTRIQWGNLTAQVTAERYVTAEDSDDIWVGQPATAYEAVWDGHPATDHQIQPLRT